VVFHFNKAVSAFLKRRDCGNICNMVIIICKILDFACCYDCFLILNPSNCTDSPIPHKTKLSLSPISAPPRPPKAISIAEKPLILWLTRPDSREQERIPAPARCGGSRKLCCEIPCLMRMFRSIFFRIPRLYPLS